MPNADSFDETILFPGRASAGEDKLPERIGRFRVEKLIGSGAFGDVLLGHDATLERKVAIKSPRGCHSEAAIEAFLVEARNLAQLQHPGIVSVFDVGRDGNRVYIVTEYLQGTLLRDRIAAGQVDWIAGARIVAHLAEALAHAHSRGIIHRDVKPSNIMITSEGRCVLLDFGLAVNDLQSTRGEVAGTPAYMSPEQVRGESHRIDGRTDVYALGVVLYELLTGRKPFRSDNAQELFRRILEDAPQPIRQLNPGVPSAIDELCMRALEKEITKRFTTAGDLAAALQRGVMEAESKLSGTGSQLPKSVDSLAPGLAAAMDRTRNEPKRDAGSTSKSSSRDSSQSRRLRDAELRQVTLLGVSFDASQRYADAESQHACAERFARRIEEAVDKFGGRLCAATSNELTVCFGFPVSYEDSVARAVRCGMEILEATTEGLDLPQTAETFVAVHTGQAVAEESEQGVKISGDVAQTVHRLVTVIEGGSVIVTESSHRLSRMHFEQEELGELKVRGLAAPVKIFRVLREAPVTMNRVELVDPGNLTPLIGRDTELAVLRDRWEQALEGMGQIVLLIGEAGLGKSRLIREIRVHAAAGGDAPDILELRCSQYHQSAGLYPLIEHLTQALHLDDCPNDDARVAAIERHLTPLGLRTDQNVALLASMLGIDPLCAPKLDLPPQRTREHLSQLLLDMLRQRSELRPILFIVEDLHWVDPTLLELLTSYVDSFDQRRALSLFTFRPEFETPWRSKPHQTQIALNRLSRRQVRDMIRKRVGRLDIPDSIVDQIVDRTDGIPLFIEEFSTVLAESDSLAGGSLSDERLQQIIPTSLQDLLMARLDRLESDWEVVQMAAAIGREFPFSLLAAASELSGERLEAELTKLVDAEILFQKGKAPDASFIFKHALIQDSAYNSLLTKRRQHMHARIASALESRFPEIVHRQPELLAHHFTEAAQPEQAVGYWLKAGVKAQLASANVEAISQLRQGLEVLQSLAPSRERDQLEFAFQATLGPVLMAARGWSAPEVGVAIARARQLCSEFGSVSDQFFVMWGLWGWQLIRGDMECVQVAQDLLQLVESTAEAHDLKSEAYWVVAGTDYYHGDFVRASSWLKRAMALIEPERERQFSLRTGQYCSVLCGSHAAMVTWQLGFPDQALALAEETVRNAKLLNHPFSFAMAIFFRRLVFEFVGREAEARSSIEAEYAICHEHGIAYFEVHAIFGRGEVLLRQGKRDEARQQLDLGWQMRSAMGGKNSMDYAYRNIAEAYLDVGSPDEAELWLQRGMELVEQNGKRGLESEFLRLRGDQSLAQGDEAGAEGYYERALANARRQEALSLELRSTIRLAELRRRQGRIPEGRTLLASCYARFTEGFASADLRRAKKLLDALEAHS